VIGPIWGWTAIEVCERLQEAMEKQGLGPSELAQELQLSESEVKSWLEDQEGVALQVHIKKAVDWLQLPVEGLRCPHCGLAEGDVAGMGNKRDNSFHLHVTNCQGQLITHQEAALGGEWGQEGPQIIDDVFSLERLRVFVAVGSDSAGGHLLRLRLRLCG